MSMDNNFLVVSPTYNTAPYIEKCVMSVLNQTYRKFDHLTIDDCCTDGTTEILLSILTNYKGNNFFVHRNIVRRESPLGNFALGIELFSGDDEDIIVTVDGDDWLYDNGVLEYLNEVYQDPDVWMTYGSFISASGKIQGMCRQVKDTRTYRRRDVWVTSHLRTIKRKLWNKIKKTDLLDKNGKYYVYYPDIAYMFPAIEMAGLKHSRFIDKVLYVYNDLNPLCSAEDWKSGEGRRHIYAIDKEIRRKPVYSELRNL